MGRAWLHFAGGQRQEDNPFLPNILRRAGEQIRADVVGVQLNEYYVSNYVHVDL